MFKKLAVAAALAVVASVAPASAKMDCDAKLAEAHSALGKMSGLSAGQRAARARLAIQAYDLCTVGDEDTATKFFRMMMASGS